MPPRAVLFDFDGVIADTENVHVAAWQRTLQGIGWELSDEAALAAAEVDDRTFLRELFERRQIEGADLDGWLAKKAELAATLLADNPRVYPGVARLVEALVARGVKLAVVTTTARRNVEVVLAAAGLAGVFGRVVAAEDVSSVKPAPDGYRLGCESLGVDPGEAVALEDSPTGIASAVAAGVRVIAVGHRRAAGDWSEGHPFLAGFEDPAAALGSLGF